MKPMQKSAGPMLQAFRRASLLPKPTAHRIYQQTSIQHASSHANGQTKFDQTKESNAPSKPARTEHENQAQKSDFDEDTHPAKQPDPQQSPSKATGIQIEGPGSKAGEGQDKGVIKDQGAGPYMKQ
jgi:hypothetical protein